MRINPIQQNKNCLSSNFKGTVSPEATQFIKKCARAEAKNYVLYLQKGVKADKQILLEVQKYWNDILNKLNEKAKQMHPDTILDIRSKINCLGDICFNSFIFRNENLGTNLVKNNFSGSVFMTSNSKIGKDFRDYVYNIKPETIDKEILERTIKNLECNLKNDNLSTYSTKYPAIIVYQNQLKNITEEESKNNVIRLNKAIDDAKAKRAEKVRIEAIEQENLELLDEIFGTDK